MMRAFALVVLLVFAPCASALAQALDPPPPASTPAVEPPLEAVAAGRDFFQAVVFDNGLVELLAQVMDDELPTLRGTLMHSPLYRGATPEHQQALAAFVETLPALMLQEFRAEAAAAGGRAAPRFAARMSAEELTQVAAFMRTAAVREMWREMFNSFLADRERQQPAFPDFAASRDLDVAAFAATPAGLAFAREQENLNDILDEEMQRALANMAPRLEIAVVAGVCRALGEECPPQFRSSDRI